MVLHLLSRGQNWLPYFGVIYHYSGIPGPVNVYKISRSASFSSSSRDWRGGSGSNMPRLHKPQKPSCVESALNNDCRKLSIPCNTRMTKIRHLRKRPTIALWVKHTCWSLYTANIVHIILAAYPICCNSSFSGLLKITLAHKRYQNQARQRPVQGTISYLQIWKEQLSLRH